MSIKSRASPYGTPWCMHWHMDPGTLQWPLNRLTYIVSPSEILGVSDPRNRLSVDIKVGPSSQSHQSTWCFNSPVAVDALKIITHPTSLHLGGIYKISHHHSNGGTHIFKKSYWKLLLKGLTDRIRWVVLSPERVWPCVYKRPPHKRTFSFLNLSLSQ